VCHSTGGSGSSPTATPEIDPASAVAGLTLVVGGLIVLRGRRRSKDSNA
jgi:LPXTG-motif cell wall-anchored protein